MATVERITEVNDKVSDDPSVKATEIPAKKNFVVMSDTELMNELLDRNLPIPMDDGKLIRNATIKSLTKRAKESTPLSAYRRMRVIFHRTGKEAEAPYVFMSLNGTAFQAPYEVEVSIPEPMMRTCIDAAVVTNYDMADFNAATGSTNYVEKVIRAVPYTFLGYEEAKG